MLKTICFVITFTVLFYTEIESRSILKFKSDGEKVIVDAVRKCLPDGHEDYLQTIRDGTYYDDDDFKKFVYCGYTESGYATADGRIIADKTADVFVDHNNDMLNIINECDKPGSDPVDTMFEYFKCFQDNTEYLMNITV